MTLRIFLLLVCTWAAVAAQTGNKLEVAISQGRTMLNNKEFDYTVATLKRILGEPTRTESVPKRATYMFYDHLGFQADLGIAPDAAKTATKVVKIGIFYEPSGQPWEPKKKFTGKVYLDSKLMERDVKIAQLRQVWKPYNFRDGATRGYFEGSRDGRDVTVVYKDGEIGLMYFR